MESAQRRVIAFAVVAWTTALLENAIAELSGLSAIATTTVERGSVARYAGHTVALVVDAFESRIAAELIRTCGWIKALAVVVWTTA